MDCVDLMLIGFYTPSSLKVNSRLLGMPSLQMGATSTSFSYKVPSGAIRARRYGSYALRQSSAGAPAHFAALEMIWRQIIIKIGSDY
jgi:hypothetical protein